MPPPVTYTYPLRFARVGAVPDAWLPTLPIEVPQPDGSTKALREDFLLNSRARIALQADYTRLAAPIASSLDAVWGVDLHPALAALTQNSSHPVDPIRLGVLLAPRYGPRPDVFGVMFDLGAEDPNDPGGDHSLAREGCAVMMGAIAEGWPPAADRVAYQRQFVFTLIHEIGHIFNLQHRMPPPHTYMDEEGGDTVRDDWFRFEGVHSDQLGSCGEDDAVTPGRHRFGRIGLWENVLAGRRPRQVPRSVLALDAWIEQREFFPWEPVELEIALNARRTRHPYLPDELDPGYRCFDIWIEEPSGERRRYRATKHYCAPAAPLRWDGRAARRDVSIFLEAGRYTFRQPGMHKVWVTFRISRGLELRSKECEVRVRSLTECGKRERARAEECRRLLTAARHTLYYRSGRPRRREVEALEHFIRRFPTSESAASALYALGCLLSPRIGMKRRRPESVRAGKEYLRRAGQHEGLSTHRRDRAADRIKQLA